MKSTSPRSGFTLLEILLAAAILTIVFYKGVMVMKLAFDSSSEETTEITVILTEGEAGPNGMHRIWCLSVGTGCHREQ